MTQQDAGKVIIIGGGIAGLCAGVYARRCGYDVDLFEKHDRPGGLATSWRRGDYTFETCLHWLVGSNPAVWEFESPHPHPMGNGVTRQHDRL